MKRYAAMIRFLFWAMLMCAAMVQSQASATPDNQGKKEHVRPAGTRQRIELMVPGFTASEPYQQLRITMTVNADTAAEAARPPREAAQSSAAEGSATAIQGFVEFTGTATGQLVAAGFLLGFCWRVLRRIRREESGNGSLRRSPVVSA